MDLIFEWDPRKHRANVKKHRVGFPEAASVFGNPLARVAPDDDHAEDETRAIIIGHSKVGRLLFVQ